MRTTTTFKFSCPRCGFTISPLGVRSIPAFCPHCNNAEWISDSEVEKLEREIRWEQRRYELSKEFLLRVQFTPEVFDACLDSSNRADTVAQVAVMMADAIIKHLRKDETEQSD